MCDRFAIYKARDRLTKDQRRRKVNVADIAASIFTFNHLVADQLKLDYWVGFKAWDSFSMILQCEMCVPENQVEKFAKWAFRRLGLSDTNLTNSG